MSALGDHTFDPYWVTDPGHGWLAVPLAEVERLGLKPSEFSFIKGPIAFLEEDCDAGLYLDATGTSARDYTVHQVAEFHRPARRFLPS